MTTTMKNLTDEYNTLLDTHNSGQPRVKKFQDIKTGQTRLEALKASFPDYGAVEVEKSVPHPEPKYEEVFIEAVSGQCCSGREAPPEELTASPEVQSLFRTNPEKFRPAIEAMLIKYRLLLKDPALTRKAYIAACTARGIKASTAGQQWGFTLEELQKRFTLKD